MLKLYDYYRSSACFRVRIALNLKDIAYDAIPIHLLNNGGEQHSQEYLQVNPQGLVPSLDDNNQIITQSLAIIEYLEEVHPTPALLPKSPYEKALVRAFALTIAADTHPLNNLRVWNYLKDDLHVTEEQKNEWYQHWMRKACDVLEKLIVNHANQFCFGNTPTLADICLVPHLFNARRFNFDLTNYPALVRIDHHCQKLEAFKKAWPVEPITS